MVEPAPSAEPATVAASAAPAEVPAETVPAPAAPVPLVEFDENVLPPNQYDSALSKARASALSAVQADGATDGWTFHSRSQDVDVFLKSIPGSTTQECKGVGTIEASAKDVEMVFNDSQFRTVRYNILHTTHCTTLHYTAPHRTAPTTPRYTALYCSYVFNLAHVCIFSVLPYCTLC